MLKQGVSPEMVEKIIQKVNLPVAGIQDDNSKIKKNIDSLFLNGIFEVYSEENQKQSKNGDTLNQLNSLLTDEFSRQQTSLLQGITLEQKDNNVTHFSTKTPLNITNSNSNDKTSELGSMQGKSSATLYADKLKIAKPEDKASFYEAIFLRAMYGESFERNADGTLKLMKSTLSIASLPQDQVLRNEALEHLALFKKKYPNIDVKMDSLPQADKDKFSQLVGAQSNNQATTIKFNDIRNAAIKNVDASENTVLQTNTFGIPADPGQNLSKRPEDQSTSKQALGFSAQLEQELKKEIEKRRIKNVSPRNIMRDPPLLFADFPPPTLSKEFSDYLDTADLPPTSKEEAYALLGVKVEPPTSRIKEESLAEKKQQAYAHEKEVEAQRREIESKLHPRKIVAESENKQLDSLEKSFSRVSDHRKPTDLEIKLERASYEAKRELESLKSTDLISVDQATPSVIKGDYSEHTSSATPFRAVAEKSLKKCPDIVAEETVEKTLVANQA